MKQELSINRFHTEELFPNSLLFNAADNFSFIMWGILVYLQTAELH